MEPIVHAKKSEMGFLIIVGDGNSAFPSGIHLELTLQDERRFRNGMLYLHYRSTTSQAA